MISKENTVEAKQFQNFVADNNINNNDNYRLEEENFSIKIESTESDAFSVYKE